LQRLLKKIWCQIQQLHGKSVNVLVIGNRHFFLGDNFSRSRTSHHPVQGQPTGFFTIN
jgi:hypothetical protein